MANEETRGEPVKLITLEELMKLEEKVEWRIEGFLPKGCVAVISGISGVKRSFFLEQMGLSLATGEDFLCYSIPQKCKTLMYEAELTKGELKERASKMLKWYSPTTDLLFNSNYSLRLDKQYESLTQKMNELGIEVVILDHLYMMHSGDIRDEQAIMTFMNPLETYCLETGRNIIVAAHSTKVYEQGNQKQNRGASGRAVKGTSAQVQVAAYVWTLSDSFAEFDNGHLIFEKTRDIPRPKPLPIVFKNDTFTFQQEKIPDDYMIAWVEQRKPDNKTIAAGMLKERFGIGHTKAYEMLKGKYKDVAIAALVSA